MKKVVLWFLILFLPTQLGIHFWPEFSFVSGFKIDYLSPTTYLTDLIIIFYILFSWKKPTLNPLFLTLIFINVFFSTQPLLSLFFWAKLSLYILLFTSLLRVHNLKELVYTPLLISTVLVILIQFVQLFSQKSIGGPLYFLGERTFNFYTPNIAKINLSYLGTIIRPYSIFSHPNSLAGYLLLALVILKQRKAVRNLKRSAGGLRTISGLHLFFVEGLIYLAILLTFSKAAILTLLLLQIKNLKILKQMISLAFLVGFFPLLVNFIHIKYSPGNSFLERAYMGYPTLEIIKQNFFTGTGLKGFIPSLSQQLSPSQINHSSLQPVHSLPLLILSELGIVGVILIYSLIKNLKITNQLLIQTLFIITLTGAVDHYWWTLPQNQLILILALTLALSCKKEAKGGS